MPVHIVERLNGILRTERRLRSELGREPTDAEVGFELDLRPEKVDQIRRSAQPPISLDKPLGDTEDAEFGHLIPDESLPLPEDAAETSSRNEALTRILCTLPARERRVLELRYGLDGREPQTLEEVGLTFDVSRERIRQIEKQALGRLQALPQAREIA
jgi:RNA polymerase primary sigma factor